MLTALQWSFIWSVVTGLLLAAAGLLVGWKGHFKGRFGAFALYAASFGLGVAIGSLPNVIWGGYDMAQEPWPYFALFWISILSVVPTLIGLHWLIRTTGDLPRKTGWAMLGLAVATAALWLAAALQISPGTLTDPTERTWATMPAVVSFGLRDGGMIAAGMAFAWRARLLRGEAARDNAILGFAVLLYPLMHMLGWSFDTQRFVINPSLHWFTLWPALLLAVCTALWLLARDRSSSRAALAAALMLPAVGIIAIYGGANFSGTPSPPSMARILEVVLVAYAISRGQFMGLDTRVRWGISKTTIAATFVAVFFIVSEFAAATFSEQWGTELGIVAAGALVFGIAPIMRWADRFAARAIPAGLDAEGILANSLRLALKDGHIDPDEELALAAQAEQLGVSALRLLELRRQVER